MIDAQAIKAEADYKRITFLRAAARARAGHDAQAPAGQARMRSFTRLHAVLAGVPLPGRSSRPARPVLGWIGELLGRPG